MSGSRGNTRKKNNTPQVRKQGKPTTGTAKKRKPKKGASNQRTTVLIGGGVLAACIALIAAAVIFSPSNTIEADPGAPVPAGAFDASGTYPYALTPNGEVNPGAPVVELYEDPQCPACARLATSTTALALKQAHEAGDITLLQRPVAILDAGGTKSADAINAYGCALDQGAGDGYWFEMFSQQQNLSSAGFSSGALEEIAAKAIPDDAALQEWKSCVAEGTYLPWSANTTKEFTDAGVTSTPALLVNGVRINNNEFADPDQLLETITNTN